METLDASKSHGEWISLHIFYGGRQDRLLKELSAPVRELIESQDVTQFFFIRYWLKGPHIRLRMRLSPGRDKYLVTAAAKRRCQEIIDAHPSVVAYDNGFSDGVELYKTYFTREYGPDQPAEFFTPDGLPVLERNNSVINVPYIPEIDRYGGGELMEVCHRHFQSSSQIILRLISDGQLVSQGQRLGRGAHMMIAAIAGFTRNDIAHSRELAAMHRDFWIRYVTDRERFDSHVAQCCEMSDLYELARQFYGPQQSVQDTPYWIDTFYRDSHSCGSEISEKRQDCDTIFSSLIHMNNNRLSVTPALEAQVSSVVLHILTDLAQ